MHINHVIVVLRIRSDQISCEDDSCTVDENVQTAELFGNGKPQVDQVLVGVEIALDGESLRWVLLRDAVELTDVPCDQSNASSIVQIPKGERASDTTGCTRDQDNLVKEVTRGF